MGSHQLCTLRGHSKNFLNYEVNLSMNFVLIIANSADPDEMQHYAAFNLILHCLPKYLLRGGGGGGGGGGEEVQYTMS